MTKSPSSSKRIDTASRIIRSSAERIYSAFMKAEAIAVWLPPDGMRGEVHAYNPKVGGEFRMTLIYENVGHSTPGKTSDNADVVQGRFVEFTPNKRIVQLFKFESNDPAFAGEMRMTWSLNPHPEGTEVIITCEDVPEGIRREDHEVGMTSTLDNLAAYVDQSLKM